jgi:membrane dipeptidase
MRRKLLAFVALLAVALIGLRLYGHYRTVRLDRKLNPVIHRPLYDASAKARALRERLLVLDMHADTLLWERDPLLGRSGRGQLDLPRMVEANEALQFFTVVTHAPKHENIERNTNETDEITFLYLARLKPPTTWFSRTSRALNQAEFLHRTARNSGGRLTVIQSRADLDSFLQRRRADRQIVGGLLGIEGAHALDGKLASWTRWTRRASA